jgi:hypothetical protein
MQNHDSTKHSSRGSILSSDQATGWTTAESWFGSRRFEEIFPSSKGSRPALGNIHHPSQRLGQAVFPVTKRSVRKTDISDTDTEHSGK